MYRDGEAVQVLIEVDEGGDIINGSEIPGSIRIPAKKISWLAGSIYGVSEADGPTGFVYDIDLDNGMYEADVPEVRLKATLRLEMQTRFDNAAEWIRFNQNLKKKTKKTERAIEQERQWKEGRERRRQRDFQKITQYEEKLGATTVSVPPLKNSHIEKQAKVRSSIKGTKAKALYDGVRSMRSKCGVPTSGLQKINIGEKTIRIKNCKHNFGLALPPTVPKSAGDLLSPPPPLGLDHMSKHFVCTNLAELRGSSRKFIASGGTSSWAHKPPPSGLKHQQFLQRQQALSTSRPTPKPAQRQIQKLEHTAHTPRTEQRFIGEPSLATFSMLIPGSTELTVARAQRMTMQ
jgi:hypothetical protein